MVIEATSRARRIEMIAAAYRRAGIVQGDTLETMAKKSIEYFPPGVEIVEENEGRCVLKITTCPDTSVMMCMMNGGNRYEGYALPEGKEHALVRVGGCSLTVDHHFRGELLKQIQKIALKVMLPVGSIVFVSLTVSNRRGPLTNSLMEGWTIINGKKIETFEPSTIITFDPTWKKPETT